MFGDIIQPTHLLFILVVALLVLGPKRLPEVGRSLGRGLRDFRQGMQGVEAEAKSIFSDPIDSSAEAPADRVEAVVQAPTPGKVVQAAIPGPDAPIATAASEAPVATAVATEPDPADYAD
jgi:sec-independent protein translocase protein TatA